jgi:hypothetical protein
MRLRQEGRRGRLNNQGGQVVVEYVLLLIAVVAIAALITRLVVSRDPEAPGFLISKWVKIVEVIATDVND